MNKIREIWSYICSRKSLFLLIAALLLFGSSLIRCSSPSIERQTSKVQRQFHKREKILERYISIALEKSPDEWLDPDKFPDDMVLYKYNADTLQSWINQFPISNDEVDLFPLWYRIHDLSNRNLYNTPLAYVDEGEQYMNLGSSWYVVNSRREGNVKIIAGILVKTEYINENAALKNSVNKKIGLTGKYTSVPTYIEDRSVIYSSSGEALFSIVDIRPLEDTDSRSVPIFMAVILVLISLTIYQSSKHNFKSLFISLAGLAGLRIVTTILSDEKYSGLPFFSPTLFADGLFNSIGGLLLSHFFVFMALLFIFLSRRKIVRHYLSSKKISRRFQLSLLIILTLALAIYIHFTLRSIIINSNIVLELYRLDDISIYSLVIFAAYALLYMGLLFLLHILNAISTRVKRFSFFSVKSLVTYILLAALYSTFTISVYGFRKEYKNNRVWTDKLAVERDLTLELQLRSIENQIMADPMIRLFIGVPRGETLIINRLAELYFWNISSKYDLRITICGEGEQILTENYPHPTDCFEFFKNDIIMKYGIQLAPSSSFYYVNNYQNRISYIGAFSVLRDRKRYDMYLEIDSKLTKEAIGYPSLLLDSQNSAKSSIGYYSYAKYYDRRLISSKGRYDYPVYYDTSTIPEGYSYFTTNGYIHFANKVSDDNIIVVSRPVRKFLMYVVFFSYLVLFLGFVILGLTRISRKRHKEELFSLPRHSFRKKITYLLTTSMVFALLAMGIGSIIFTIRLIDDNSTMQMKEKLLSVQKAISDMCKYAQSYNEINNHSMFGAMDGVAVNTQVEINLYDPHGRLIRATKPEIFDQYLLSSRMNPEAYYNIVYKNKMQYIHEETIAKMTYHSLYAPIFNIYGTMVAIANVPYFVNTSDFKEDASSIIATIINIYLLLLIAAILAGITISNSVSKPLAIISKKMEDMDFSQKAEHINYKGEDELGLLVKSYNKMVDDLDTSTKQLAQSEREQAWREMARQIAHEIKNPLTPMKLSIQYLVRLKKQHVPGWENRFEALSVSLIEQIDILSETATEFSSFAKFYNEDDVEMDLIALLKEQFVLFDNRETLSLEFRCSLESAMIMAKKSQIGRAFVNLISNAIQAIEYKRDGLVRITVVKEDEFYRIDVEDNGNGVSEENRQRLFKPNFTTKTSGTGLGLAICKNIMDQSRGEIGYCKSELGGADFFVRLPILPEE